MKYFRLLLPLLLLSPSIANADAKRALIDGLNYTLYDDHTATVTGEDNTITGDMIIPPIVFYEDETYAVTQIGWGALSYTKATSITVPNSVTFIDSGAFKYSSTLASLILPNAITEIPSDMCYDDEKLTSIVIPHSVAEVGSYAFRECSALAKVTIGRKVKKFGDAVFLNDKELKEIYNYANPDSLESLPSWTFRYITLANVTMHVVVGTAQKWKTKSYWKSMQIVEDLTDEGEEPSEIYPDVNGDGSVNVSDVNLVVSEILRHGNNEMCDVNADGQVNVTDVNLIVSEILNN